MYYPQVHKTLATPLLINGVYIMNAIHCTGAKGWGVRVLGLLVVLTCSGCAFLDIDPGGQEHELKNTRWALLHIQAPDALLDASVLEESSALFLSDQLVEDEVALYTMGGSTGCNAFGGTYALSGPYEIELEITVTTLRFCGPPAGTFEAAWFEHLREVTHYERFGDRLTLRFDGGYFAFQAAEVERSE